jgi:alanyl-tRNA synthetase
MGLERVASVVQGQRSNYEGDLFRSLLESVSAIVGRPYEGGDRSDSVSMRVIADHARAAAFLLADDVHPDKTGRGYVLRKIMRRAISHGVLLGVSHPFLAAACEAVADAMGRDHPVLRERLRSVQEGAQGEESLFRRTVEEGMRRIDELLQQLENDDVWSVRDDGVRVLTGDTAFRLYDTYGCPLELTASVGVRRGFEVDEEGFQRALQEQKERSRASWKGGAAGAGAAESFLARDEVGVTDFTGYETLEGESEIRALALVDGGELRPADRAGEGSLVAIATAATPFYGESGGQIGDTGSFVCGGGRVRIEDTQKVFGGEVWVHFGAVEEGEIGPGDRVAQEVDRDRRRRIMEHHSATHLVHLALREILGDHVSQKGSYVGPDRLRFDFSHAHAVEPAQLSAIEDRVNELVRDNSEVVVAVLPYRKAIEQGALAFFGDKYGDEVRMVTMGPSKELCGGTHVGSTGDLGLFTFSSEGSVASGVRRIEAFAGPRAVEHLRKTQEQLARVAQLLKAGPNEVVGKIAELQEETRRLKRRVEELERETAKGAADSLASSAVEIAGHRLIVGAAPVESREALRELGDSLRASGTPTVVVLAAEMEGKVVLVAAVSDDVVKGGRLRAGDLVGRVARVAGGGGGGKPHLATAGAKDPARLPEALEAVPEIVREILG